MDREQARQEIRGRLEEYLRQQGINTRKPFNCLNPDHPDTHPSMSFDPKRNKCHCFACGADYDTFDLIGIDEGLTDPKEIFEAAYKYFSLEVDKWDGLEAAKRDFAPEGSGSQPLKDEPAPTADYMDYYRERMEHIGECDYLAKRGISKETAVRFMLGYDPAWRHPKAPQAVPTTPRLIIPTSKESYLARDTREEMSDQEKERKKMKVGSVRLYNAQALDRYENESVFITEGEIDALSIIEAGGEAVGLGSAGNYKKLVDRVEKKKPTATLILALDNDNPGKETASKLKTELDRLGILYIMPSLYGEAKDANEALINDRASLERAVAEAKDTAAAEARAIKEAEKEDYLKLSVANHLDQFRQNIKDSEKAAFFPTGFKKLDEILDGGLYAGLYVIGAITSLGKTTFCLQVCDQIAAAGHDVIVFSLEMSKDELIAKSISRHTYLEAVENYGGATATAKTTRGVLTGSRWAFYSRDDLDTLNAAMNNYSEYAGRIFIHEGVGNIGVEQIKETVERHIRVTGNRPIILIDYLQILAPYDTRATDKQNTDKAVLELKRLSRDSDIPIIGISSFNRDNYTSPVNNASFKESGAIEYSSDVLIGLQYYGMDYQKGEGEAKRRTRVNELLNRARQDGKAGRAQNIQIKVLKNRNGAKGDLTLDYFPMFNYYRDRVADPGADSSKPIDLKARAEAKRGEEYKQMSVNEDWEEIEDEENPFYEF